MAEIQPGVVPNGLYLYFGLTKEFNNIVEFVKAFSTKNFRVSLDVLLIVDIVYYVVELSQQIGFLDLKLDNQVIKFVNLRLVWKSGNDRCCMSKAVFERIRQIVQSFYRSR